MNSYIAPRTLRLIMGDAASGPRSRPSGYAASRHIAPRFDRYRVRALSLEAALTIAFLSGMLASLVVLITMAWFVGVEL